MNKLVLAAAALAISTLSATAQHQGHGAHGAAPQGASASTKAYQAANDRMHKDMSIKFSGDADIDFFKGMIPHHQGAIDMAKAQLLYGRDPVLRRLAQEIIVAQQQEIEVMRRALNATSAAQQK